MSSRTVPGTQPPHSPAPHAWCVTGERVEWCGQNVTEISLGVDEGKPYARMCSGMKT